MRLHDLRPQKGLRKTAKRKGRGIGSGLGKTAGRGQKGQKARSGYRLRPGFEGGQLPLVRRVPKRGFTNIFGKEWAIVNVETLNRFENQEVITPDVLMEKGIIKSVKDGVKILGRGELEKELVVRAHSFSKTAKQKIEAAGGKAEVI